MKRIVIHNRPNHTGMPRTNCVRAVAAVAFFIGINIVIAETAAVAQERPTSLTNILKQTDVSELVDQAMQQGDADRGKSIFHREKLGCVKCHVASPEAIKQGMRSIGPDQRTSVTDFGLSRLSKRSCSRTGPSPKGTSRSS